MPAYDFDAGRDMLKKSDMFQRYNVPDGPGEPFTVRQMAYHHLAQGVLGAEPFLLTFLPVCHSGVGLSPIDDVRDGISLD